MNWKLRRRILNRGETPLVMGILNITPDSFSDGGKFFRLDDAVSRALEMEDQGAAIIDIGAESSRPYSDPVSDDEQLSRLVPVLQKLSGRLSVPVSIDTMSSQVARAAIDLGVEIVNDVSGLEADPQMVDCCAATGVGICVMHIKTKMSSLVSSGPFKHLQITIRVSECREGKCFHFYFFEGAKKVYWSQK